MTLARTILDHLRVTGVILSLKPPIEGHGRRASDAEDERAVMKQKLIIAALIAVLAVPSAGGAYTPPGPWQGLPQTPFAAAALIMGFVTGYVRDTRIEISDDNTAYFTGADINKHPRSLRFSELDKCRFELRDNVSDMVYRINFGHLTGEYSTSYSSIGTPELHFAGDGKAAFCLSYEPAADSPRNLDHPIEGCRSELFINILVNQETVRRLTTALELIQSNFCPAARLPF